MLNQEHNYDDIIIIAAVMISPCALGSMKCMHYKLQITIIDITNQRISYILANLKLQTVMNHEEAQGSLHL